MTRHPNHTHMWANPCKIECIRSHSKLRPWGFFASRIPWSFKNFIWGLLLVLKGNWGRPQRVQTVTVSCCVAQVFQRFLPSDSQNGYKGFALPESQGWSKVLPKLPKTIVCKLFSMFIAVTCKHKQSQTCGQHVVMVSHVQRADCHVGSTYRLEGLPSYLPRLDFDSLLRANWYPSWLRTLYRSGYLAAKRGWISHGR